LDHAVRKWPHLAVSRNCRTASSRGSRPTLAGARSEVSGGGVGPSFGACGSTNRISEIPVRVPEVRGGGGGPLLDAVKDRRRGDTCARLLDRFTRRPHQGCGTGGRVRLRRPAADAKPNCTFLSGFRATKRINQRVQTAMRGLAEAARFANTYVIKFERFDFIRFHAIAVWHPQTDQLQKHHGCGTSQPEGQRTSGGSSSFRP